MSNENNQDLWRAAERGSLEAVRQALRNGANVNAKNSFFGNTPLHSASARGYEDVVSLLLENGANVNVTDDGGWTPLQRACSFGQEIICSLLIQQNGAKNTINARNEDGNTPLHYASQNGYASICLLLIRNGANPNITNDDGKTPLQEAQSYNKQDCVDVINQLQQQFYQHFDELVTLVRKATINQVITLVPTFERACQDMTDFLQLKYFFTAVNAQYRLGTITSEDRRSLIVACLDKAKDWCTSPSCVAVFRIAVSYSKSEGIITEFQQYQYEEEATLQNVANSDLIQAMQAAIQQNTARIDQMENAFVKFQTAVATSIQELQRNLNAINESVNSLHQDAQMIAKAITKFQATYKFKKRVEAGCSLVSAILNAVSFGAAGSALQGVLGFTVAHIADFGDLAHLRSVMTTLTLPHAILDTVGDFSVHDMLEQGISLVEVYGDSALDDAIVNQNSIVVMSASAAVFANALEVEEVGNIPLPAQKPAASQKKEDGSSVPDAHAMAIAPSSNPLEKKLTKLNKKRERSVEAAHTAKGLGEDEEAAAIYVEIKEIERQIEEIHDKLDELDLSA